MMFSLGIYRDCVPADLAQWAKDIYDRFAGANWGASTSNSGGSSSTTNGNNSTSSAAPSPATSDAISAAAAAATVAPAAAAPAAPAAPTPAAPTPAPSTTGNPPAIRLPPTNHPIWGLNGILHGLYMQPTRPNHPRSYHIDPRYADQKQPANHFGHNGLTPGSWWPLQLAAVYHGAHGSPIKGIFGTPTDGAYSIVVSGRATPYQDLNEDRGGTLLYSADRPTAAGDNILHPSADTRALLRSEQTRLPVRVLRSAGPHNRAWAPSVGIRYDGLYRVAGAVEASNGAGGRVWKFRLERLREQVSDLATIRDSVPSRRQVREERRMKFGY
jgi:hypothetical protein